MLNTRALALTLPVVNPIASPTLNQGIQSLNAPIPSAEYLSGVARSSSEMDQALLSVCRPSSIVNPSNIHSATVDTADVEPEISTAGVLNIADIHAPFKDFISVLTHRGDVIHRHRHHCLSSPLMTRSVLQTTPLPTDISTVDSWLSRLLGSALGALVVCEEQAERVHKVGVLWFLCILISTKLGNAAYFAYKLSLIWCTEAPMDVNSGPGTSSKFKFGPFLAHAPTESTSLSMRLLARLYFDTRQREISQEYSLPVTTNEFTGSIVSSVVWSTELERLTHMLLPHRAAHVNTPGLHNPLLIRDLTGLAVELLPLFVASSVPSSVSNPSHLPSLQAICSLLQLVAWSQAVLRQTSAVLLVWTSLCSGEQPVDVNCDISKGPPERINRVGRTVHTFVEDGLVDATHTNINNESAGVYGSSQRDSDADSLFHLGMLLVSEILRDRNLIQTEHQERFANARVFKYIYISMCFTCLFIQK